MALETATNPNTGERVALVNGQWQPIAQTATNKEGKKAYLVGEQWLTDEPSLPEVTVTPDSMTVSEVPGPRAQPPAWAKDFPGLYQGAQTARQMLGPTIEAGGAVAGGLLGAPAGPAGVVAGSAAGYGLGAGALRQADIALGNIPDMTPMEGLEAGTRDLLMGAIFEAGGRVAAPFIDKALQLGARGAGWLYDTLSGQIGAQKAAKILRDSLGVDVAAARTAARNAPVDVTAAQSIAGLTSPTTQALLEQAAKRDPRYLLSTAEAQDAARINQLAQLAGAESQAGAKTAQKEAKQELRNRLIPTLEQEMEAANLAGVLEPQLRAQAERMGAVAGQKVEDVRRMTAAAERLPRMGAARGAAERGLPTPARYTYEGELGERAAQVAEKAAEGSLIFGEASRFATAAANSLEAHNLKPLKVEKVTGYIDNLLADPKLAPGSRDLVRLLNMTKNDLVKWTNAGGVIDAWAIDMIRKNLNANARKIAGADPTAQKELASKVNQSVVPVIVDAVEAAGGTGYRAYLDAYSKGLKAVGEKKLSARALEMYQSSPAEFVKLVEGNNLKEVEKVFGAGSYDIAKEMSESAMKTLKGVAGEIKRDIRVGEQAAAGRDALRELLEANQSRFRLPSFALSRTVTATNTALDALEAKLGKAVMNKLTEASKSGQDMAKLLDTLPAVERNKVLRAFNNPQEWMVMPKEGRGAAAVNMLAPESENNLGK